MEAEKGAGQVKDEMIKELRSDKVYLQQQVTHLEELLQQHVEQKEIQQVKSGRSKLTKEPYQVPMSWLRSGGLVSYVLAWTLYTECIGNGTNVTNSIMFQINNTTVNLIIY